MFPFPDIKDCTIFPLPESTHLELKCGFNSCPRDKIAATICAFLNSEGGYIVFGVEDRTRSIIGIKADKSLDTFLLALDNSIYHESNIKSQTGASVAIGAVKSELVYAANYKQVLVITVTPDVDTKYCMRDGTRWHRLSASNYKQTATPTLYTAEELEIIVQRRLTAQKGSLYALHQAEMNKLKSKFENLEQDFGKVISIAKTAERAEQNFQEFRDFIYSTIQTQKAVAEKELEMKPMKWWQQLICCF